MIGVIKGTGAYVPPLAVDNEAIARLVETSDAWIRERTGISKRHIAIEDTASSMAVRAAKEALASARLAPERLDMILVSTMSPDRVMPCVACEVQKAMGAENAVCFDLNAACSGFLLAYTSACAYVESGCCQNVLIIGSECLSSLINWQDRSTCILFGDGAGAAVIGAAPGERYQPVFRSDGALGEALTLAGRANHNAFRPPEQEPERDRYLEMDGQAVFRFAVKQVPQVIEEVLAKNRLEKADIRYYVLHQANRRIVEAAARRLAEPPEKFPMNLAEYGNTSSASIPLLLHELRETGALSPGDQVVMAGFGGGLTYGAVILRWQ